MDTQSNSSSPALSQIRYPRVSIIILNWNKYKDTSQCIDAVQNNNYPNYDIFVVDNGSSDDSGEQLARDYPEIEFIFNDRNLGFAAGNNVGIEKAISEGADHVLLLNNDTKPRSNFLFPLVETAESEDRTAAVSGVVYDENGEIQSAGGSYSPILYKLNTNTEVSADSAFETQFVTGALMLLTGEFLHRGYRFDEGYFFGREDIDLALTAKRDGWKLIINPDSKILHNRGASAGNLSQFRFYNRARNYLYFASRNMEFYQKGIFHAAFSIIGPILVVYLIIKDRPDLIKAMLLGVYDYYRGRDFRKMKDFNDSDDSKASIG